MKMEQRKSVKIGSLGNVEDTETEGPAWGWGVGGIHAGRSDLTQISPGSHYGPPKISRIFVRQERRVCGNMWSLSPSETLVMGVSPALRSVGAEVRKRACRLTA